MQFLMERLDPAPFDLEAAIQAQIQRLVSSRLMARGRAAQDAFGMPSIVELGAADPAGLAAYAARLTHLIGLYEPRLRQPQVKLRPHNDPAMPYTLQVSGTLADRDTPQKFHFNLTEQA